MTGEEAWDEWIAHHELVDHTMKQVFLDGWMYRGICFSVALKDGIGTAHGPLLTALDALDAECVQ